MQATAATKEIIAPVFTPAAKAAVIRVKPFASQGNANFDTNGFYKTNPIPETDTLAAKAAGITPGDANSPIAASPVKPFGSQGDANFHMNAFCKTNPFSRIAPSLPPYQHSLC